MYPLQNSYGFCRMTDNRNLLTVNNFIIVIELSRILAEREGFEPPIAFRLWLISSQLHSTGLCHLSVVLPG